LTFNSTLISDFWSSSTQAAKLPPKKFKSAEISFKKNLMVVVRLLACTWYELERFPKEMSPGASLFSGTAPQLKY